MTQNNFNNTLLDFLESSPTPFHATLSMSKVLDKEGFTKLNEAKSWNLNKGEKYYLTRNDSSIIAFIYGEKELKEEGKIK